MLKCQTNPTLHYISKLEHAYINIILVINDAKVS
jgi:hypothetical protein